MIKTWQERVASIPYLSIGMPLTAHDKEAAMQDEIDELRKENARLRDALRHLAETHAWLAFGECRAFGTGRRMLTSAEADKVARAALGES